MRSLLILGAAIGVTGYTMFSMLKWITAGDDWPGEYDNPLVELDLSEVEFLKEGRNLQVQVNLKDAEERQCILITSKQHGDALHILVQKADPPEGIFKMAYSMADENGRYSATLKVNPRVDKVLYGPDKIEILI